jgi:plastocyanin
MTSRRIAKLALAILLISCSSASPMSSPPPGAVVVAATGDSFTTSLVTAAADGSFTIYFQINDSTQHDLRVWNGDTSVAAPEGFGGPSARTLEVPALGAGTYRLTCDIHPSMQATLEVE